MVDGLLIVASMTDDSLTAYDLATGVVRWQFFAGGPIRFAPAAAAGRVYCGSDDGYLYCLTARYGKLLWRVRGGPAVAVPPTRLSAATSRKPSSAEMIRFGISHSKLCGADLERPG